MKSCRVRDCTQKPRKCRPPGVLGLWEVLVRERMVACVPAIRCDARADLLPDWATVMSIVGARSGGKSDYNDGRLKRELVLRGSNKVLRVDGAESWLDSALET